MKIGEKVGKMTGKKIGWRSVIPINQLQKRSIVKSKQTPIEERKTGVLINPHVCDDVCILSIINISLVLNKYKIWYLPIRLITYVVNVQPVKIIIWKRKPQTRLKIEPT